VSYVTLLLRTSPIGSLHGRRQRSQAGGSGLLGEEPHGATADQIARTIGLGVTVEPVQDELEEMVRRGEVDRRGIGLGAVYTLAAGM